MKRARPTLNNEIKYTRKRINIIIWIFYRKCTEHNHLTCWHRCVHSNKQPNVSKVKTNHSTTLRIKSEHLIELEIPVQMVIRNCVCVLVMILFFFIYYYFYCVCFSFSYYLPLLLLLLMIVFFSLLSTVCLCFSLSLYFIYTKLVFGAVLWVFLLRSIIIYVLPSYKNSWIQFRFLLYHRSCFTFGLAVNAKCNVLKSNGFPALFFLFIIIITYYYSFSTNVSTVLVQLFATSFSRNQKSWRETWMDLCGSVCDVDVLKYCYYFWLHFPSVLFYLFECSNSVLVVLVTWFDGILSEEKKYVQMSVDSNRIITLNER